MTENKGYVNAADFITGSWPSFLPEIDASALDNIWVEPMQSGGGSVATSVLFEQELALTIPGLDAIALTIAAKDGGTVVPLEVGYDPEFCLKVTDVPIGLRLKSDMFRPARKVAGKPDEWEVDPSVSTVDVTLASVSLEIDGDGNFDVDVDAGITLPPCMIGDTGIVIEASDIKLHLNADSPPEGKTAGWRGLSIGKAALYLPGELAGAAGKLEMTNCYIGNGGFCGSIAATFTPALSTDLGGMTVGLKSVNLTFVQNSLTESRITGVITLPFFDEPVNVTIGINLDGSFSVKLDSTNGLITLTKPGVLSLTVDGLGFEVSGKVFTVRLSGTVKPLIGGLDWPGVQVSELAIDSDGNVKIDGGWLNLKDQYSLDFYGFNIEITKLGFGKTDDGGRWIGMSGAVKLVDGLPAGASVDGLRITWYTDGRSPGLSLNGVGVEFSVPDVLEFKGNVSYQKLNQGGTEVHRFDGDIKLKLVALDMMVDATLVVGVAGTGASRYTFFAIYLGVELPAGIPLLNTGLGIYGMAGLFALRMKPNKTEDEEWYEGWYKRATPGVTDLRNKWVNDRSALALGAGITLGTVSDNGYVFSGKFLLAIVFPGPILMIEGKANLMKDRAKLTDEPLFRSLFVLDCNAGSVTIGLDAKYKYPDSGKLVDISGSAKAFFKNPSNWYVYLGEKEPRDKRIRAKVLSLFEANTYWMVDPGSLQFGSWIGYDKNWKFGPVRITLEAWLEYNVGVSYRPPQLAGDLWLHGKAAIKIFGFGLGLGVDARVAAVVFEPFHLLAELSVKIDTPWPLPDVSRKIKLQWGPRLDAPPVPLPLKEIAVEHFKSTVSWPLERGSLLRPNYDGSGDGLIQSPSPAPSVIDAQSPPASAPVVPLDCRPHVTFSRAIQDDARVGVNSRPQQPEYEVVGDPDAGQGPARIRYGIKEVALQKWVGSTWAMVARSVGPDHPSPMPGIPKLYGSWAPVPQFMSAEDANPGQTKLWLWSKTAFDYTRHSGQKWDDWFTEQFENYPCIPVPPDETRCWDFKYVDSSEVLTSQWTHIDGGLIIGWLAPDKQSVVTFSSDIKGYTRGLVFPSSGPIYSLHAKRNQVFFDLSGLARPVADVTLYLRDVEGVTVYAKTIDGRDLGPFYGGTSGDPVIEISDQGITSVTVEPHYRMELAAVCVRTGASAAELAERESFAQHMVEQLAVWEDEGYVLGPDADYRIKLVTTAKRQGLGSYSPSFNQDYEQTEYAFFKTQGPPGLAGLSVPAGHPEPDEFDSGLDDLVRYVEQTVPATVPESGEKPYVAKPVFRAYDVGAEFNEDYVDLMYRIAGRDLGLYLYDNNCQPVRDAAGRLIVLDNLWGKPEQKTLSETVAYTVNVYNRSTCVLLDTSKFADNSALSSRDAGRVMDPDTVYEARMIPLLLREDFSAGLSKWMILDEGTTAAPSQWSTGSDSSGLYAKQTANIWGGTLDGDDPIKPGTMLIRGKTSWTDYRLSVILGTWGDDDAIGVVFRYRNQNNYYRFSMDHERQYRRLVRVANGVHTILAEDSFVYELSCDYLVTIEAVGSVLKVYMNGDLVFSVTDGTHKNGRIGLYCWGNTGARFNDVRVDDFQAEAPVVYKFSFTTSQFAGFFDFIHSYNDETWPLELPVAVSDSDLTSAAAAASTARVPDEGEDRAYEQLADQMPAGPPVERVEVTRLERDGDVAGLWVTSSEPVDWLRTDVEVKTAAARTDRPVAPDDVKLTEVAFADTAPGDESVTVLARSGGVLEGHRIEYLGLPGVIRTDNDRPVMFEDDFTVSGGLLFKESFSPRALDRYTISDQGTISGPSKWVLEGGCIVQKSNVYGNIPGSDADKPGTVALFGSTWQNIRLRVQMQSVDDDGIGVVFCWQDEDNFYRFSYDCERRYRRLVKKVDGEVTVLWQDSTALDPSRSYELLIEFAGGRIVGWLDNRFLFSVQDGDLKSGRTGLYTWGCQGARFEAITVEEAPADLMVHDGQGNPAQRTWTDLAAAVVVSSMRKGTMDVLFRYVDDDNHYKFQFGTFNRRLIRRTSGVDKVLWEDSAVRLLTRSWELMVEAVGSEISGFVNGKQMFSVRDSELTRGGVKVTGPVRLIRQIVVNRSRAVSSWSVWDEGVMNGPSVWASGSGMLQQTSNIGPGLRPIIGPFPIKPGSVLGGAFKPRDRVELIKPGILRPLTYNSEAGSFVTVGQASWQNYRVTAKMRPDADGGIGVMFRFKDKDNYYRLALDSRNNYQRLVKMNGGVMTTLWTTTDSFTPGKSLIVTIDVIGSRIVGYIGGSQLFEVTDSAHASGMIGLACWQNVGARFESVSVERVPLSAYALYEDGFAAGSVQGWTFIDEGTIQVPSDWSVVDGALYQGSNIHSPPVDRNSLDKRGTYAVQERKWDDFIYSVRIHSADNDAVGIMFRYQDQNNYYRWSLDAERKYRRLVKCVNGVFTLLWEDWNSYEVGRAFEMTVVAEGQEIRGYIDNIPVFVVSDPDLAQGRIGLYCWANEGTSFSQVRVYPLEVMHDRWLLEDQFQYEVGGQWTIVDEGTLDAPSQWTITGGEMVESSNIYSSDQGLSMLGTMAVAGERSWRDYRLSVRMSNDDDDGIGVVFRYENDRNYYRLSMDRQRRYRRLVKCVNGTFSTLWSDGITYKQDTEYVMTIDCLGTRLIGYLDGVQLFDIQDADLASGKIGLYSFANVGARFREVLVGAAQWNLYYEFDDEAVPAGARVRVYGGSQLAIPAGEAGMVQRSCGGLTSAGMVRLTPGCRLRMVDDKDVSGHERTFLDPDVYVPVTAKLVRKKDGTGMFVLPAGGQLPSGEYRISMRYRRDNSAADPDGVILRQAGSDADELVTIDVPGEAKLLPQS